ERIVRLVIPPGVFEPPSDAHMLAAVLREHAAGADVLDVCTGSGILAVSAGLAGARSVTAVDVSRRAVLTARLNGALNGVRVRPGGALLLVHSSVNGIDRSLEHLARAGLEPDLAARHRGPLGPILTARAPVMEARGMIAPGQREEDVVIVRGYATTTRAMVV